MQGLNYAYTLQGWLKAINPDPYTGSGFTLQPDSAGNVVANNAYSLLLNYFNGDYKPISNTAGPDNGVSTALGSGYAALYNGNISSMGVNIKKLNSPLLYNYRYDQLNRLTHMDAWKRTSTAWNALTATTDYQENVSYDPNGNILTYHRNRETTGSGNPMDQLQYSYIPGTNQLDHIYDTVPGVSNAGDIATQNAGNYKYDSIGELIGDVASNITNISWTVYGKIASITKAPDTVIRYTYDPAGNRISKTVVHGVDSIVTWYVRDAQGNILSVYASGDPAVNGRSLTQTELDLYGSSRLGIWKRAVLVANLDSTVHSSFPKSGDSLIFTRGSKLFELTNHLGNVLVTISDKRYGVSSDSMVAYYNPEVVSATDYYPFGMMQYARSWTEANVGNYRYGFNGKENDNEVKGAGNQQDYGMRTYDPRVGRFSSVDPLTRDYPWYTPYQFAGNMPIVFIDLDGMEPSTPGTKNGETVQGSNGPTGQVKDWVWNASVKKWEEKSLPTTTVSHSRIPNLRTLATRGPIWIIPELNKAKEIHGTNEKFDPTFSFGKTALMHVGIKGDEANPANTAWCAACGSLLLDASKYDNPRSAASQDWLNSKKLTYTETPYYGEGIVFSNFWDEELTDPTGKGHFSFAVGITPEGEYVGFGGNQGNTLKFSTYPATRFIGAKYGYQHVAKFGFPRNYTGPRIALPVIKKTDVDLLNRLIGIHPENKPGAKAKKPVVEPTQ